MNTFHLTLGPTQGFITQARRTRDLWAGSFLLSWLSAQAIKAVIEQGGSIQFPKVTDEKNQAIDPMLAAVMNNKDPSATPPQIGSIPNRFKAIVADDFCAIKVKTAITDQWTTLADTVYDRFIEAVEFKGLDTKSIWDRQIRNFWQINWVLNDLTEQADDDRIYSRKNWRNHWPDSEGGDHCTIMADFQEISGFIRAKSKDQQNEFWQTIRQHQDLDDFLDIREHERLCAIALVKRLFPRLSESNLKKTIGWVPGGNPRSIANWPSTTYMAVAPWLANLSKEPRKVQALSNYASFARDCIGQYFSKLVSEQSTHLGTLELLNSKRLDDQQHWHLSDLDAGLLHNHALLNYRATYLSKFPLTPEGKDNNEATRAELHTALMDLYTKVESKPRSYYALLLMDGDRLGKMLHENDQTKISEALLDFTGKVKPCVDHSSKYGGVTIYAGGDDVFALLPLDTAIQCAQALRRIYAESFNAHGIQDATASSAIVYAHHQVPLRQVIHEAHHQLDDVAKTQNGRDSLALAIYKPNGITAQWVSLWRAEHSPVEQMLELIKAMQADEYSRGFFHKLRDRYGIYSDTQRTGIPETIDVEKLLIAEFIHCRERKTSLKEAQVAVKRLIRVCQPLSVRNGIAEPSRALILDGGFIARFLTQEQD